MALDQLRDILSDLPPIPVGVEIGNVTFFLEGKALMERNLVCGLGHGREMYNNCRIRSFQKQKDYYHRMAPIQFFSKTIKEY
jgi:hypothetical protein